MKRREKEGKKQKINRRRKREKEKKKGTLPTPGFPTKEKLRVWGVKPKPLFTRSSSAKEEKKMSNASAFTSRSPSKASSSSIGSCCSLVKFGLSFSHISWIGSQGVSGSAFVLHEKRMPMERSCIREKRGRGIEDEKEISIERGTRRAAARCAVLLPFL
jgi:hypothetical protein